MNCADGIFFQNTPRSNPILYVYRYEEVLALAISFLSLCLGFPELFTEMENPTHSLLAFKPPARCSSFSLSSFAGQKLSSMPEAFLSLWSLSYYMPLISLVSSSPTALDSVSAARKLLLPRVVKISYDDGWSTVKSLVVSYFFLGHRKSKLEKRNMITKC